MPKVNGEWVEYIYSQVIDGTRVEVSVGHMIPWRRQVEFDCYEVSGDWKWTQADGTVETAENQATFVHCPKLSEGSKAGSNGQISLVGHLGELCSVELDVQEVAAGSTPFVSRDTDWLGTQQNADDEYHEKFLEFFSMED